ncbi:MAG TPA: outer membrane beta-barrel family protein [Chryseolinea sp.]|nr:outer membrane beta-barrel family protein [Chryseolinea sp.]
MKRALLIFTSVTYATIAFSQISITGSIGDGQQDLPLVSVLLLNLDSTIVKGAVTDQAGQFRIEDVAAGSYFISASMVGYSGFVSQEIHAGVSNIALNGIILEETATQLRELTITAQKPLFDQQIDRVVVNVRNSILSSGNSVLEVLQKSPGIVVNRQTNSISMNGKSPVRVMINNKLLQLPLEVVVQMLEGMNASNVEKLELIVTPPANYDAEGNGGIIHIVTTEYEGTGTHASFGLVAGAKWAETFGGNFDIHHRSKNVAYFIDYSVLRSHNLHSLEAQRKINTQEFLQTVNDYSRRENFTTQQNLNMGAEWKIGSNTFVNVLLTGYSRNWKLKASATDQHQVAADSLSTTDMVVQESNIWRSATGSLGFTTNLNSKSKVSATIDYLYYRNSNPSQYDVTIQLQRIPPQAYLIDLEKSTPIQLYIAKLDYTTDVSPMVSFEAGAKTVLSSLHNDVTVQRGIDNVWTLDTTFSSNSKLREQITAGYISTKWSTGKWQITGGLRYEHTNTTITTATQKKLTDRRYGNFFPSFLIRRNFDSERDLQFSYSRRITSPTYNDIAPFVFFWGPNTFSAGNTTLFPSLSDALTLGYHKKQWILSLQFTHAKKEITFLQPEIDESNNLIYRSQNLKYLNTLGLTNSYSISLTRFWDIHTNFTVQYQVAKAEHLSSDINAHLLNANVSVQNQLKLPRGFSIEISGLYQSKSQVGISQYLPSGSLNAGIQKSFEKAGILRLSIDDMFNTNNWRIKTYSMENHIDSHFNYYWHNRYVRLTYTWTMGNKSVQSLKVNSGSEEERGRVN